MTVRTAAELADLYADNTAGDISAADLRDFVDTFFQPRTVRIHGHQLAATTGSGRPTPGFEGPSNYLEFEIDDAAYFHFTLPSELDPTADIVIHVDWTPTGSQASRTARWALDYLVMGADASDISTADDTLTSVNEAVPGVAWQDTETTFTIPAADIAAGDHEIHAKLTRLTSTSNPSADIAVHHVWAEVTTVPPGA